MGNSENCCKEENVYPQNTNNYIGLIDHMPVVKGRISYHQPGVFQMIENVAKQFCKYHNLEDRFLTTVAKLIVYKQDNVFQVFRNMNDNQQKSQFMEDLFNQDIELIDSIYHNLVLQKRVSRYFDKQPLKIPAFIDKNHINPSKKFECTQIGNRMIAEKKVAIVFMCAGFSSRFGQDKFLYTSQNSLQQSSLSIILKRLKKNIENAKTADLSIPIIFACNIQNEYKIKDFLEDNQYFGFDNKKIKYITIPTLAIVDEKGKLCISLDAKIITRPSGTAACVEELLTSSLNGYLTNQNIQYIQFSGVQNLQQNPFDPIFFGIIQKKKLDCLAKCTTSRFIGDDFNRYVQTGKIINLLDVKALTEQLDRARLLDAPIAMNSVIYNFESLKKIIKNYKKNMFLARQYRLVLIYTNYLDFSAQNIQNKKLCYSFERDICDLVTCFSSPLLVKCPREQFNPIITKKGFYKNGNFAEMKNFSILKSQNPKSTTFNSFGLQKKESSSSLHR